MPISKKQKQILAFPYTKYDALICDGAIRAGKTAFMGIGFICWGMTFFNHQRFGICGKTVDSAIKNIIEPLMSIAWLKKKKHYKMQWRRAEKVLIVTHGQTENVFEVFGGKDESSFMLIQGRTLAGVLLDEVALQPRSFVEQALARCSVEGSKLWFNCNPAGPSHWFYQEWILKAEEHNAIRLHFQLEDNPALSEKIVNRYKSMYSGVFYRRYILGEWCVAEGLVYDFFGEDQIVDEIPKGAEYYISVDYGTQNPFSAGLWAVTGGKATRIKEYYYNGRAEQKQRTDEEYCDDVEKLAEGYKIRAIIVDPSAASFIAAMRKRNFVVRKAKNDVLDGIRFTARLLKNGNVKIHRSCTDCIREFGLYCWDDKATEDTVIKDNDHCLTGETLVDTITGQKHIKDLCGRFGLVWSVNRKGKRCIRPFFGARKTGRNQTIYRVTLENGKTIDCTGEHRVLTKKGWKRAEYLNKSDEVIDISDE